MKRNLKAEQEALKKVGGNQDAINQSVYGSATPVFEDTYGLPELQSRIDELTGKLDRRTLNEPKYLRKVTNKLKESRPYYGQTQESLNAKYGTEGSDSYIKNPYERQSLISGALNNSTQSLGDYTAQMKELYGLETGRLTSGLTEAGNAYNRALQSYQTGREEEEQRYNRMIVERDRQDQLNASASRGSSGSGRSSSGSSTQTVELDPAQLREQEKVFDQILDPTISESALTASEAWAQFKNDLIANSISLSKEQMAYLQNYVYNRARQIETEQGGTQQGPIQR